MAVKNAMFIFEVVVSDVTTLVDCGHMVIRSEFSDIFSLELKDPKTMYIVMPEPPPLPPEPVGKKGKKPKPKKGKKGKAVIELPPPKPDIQSGQSVLFTSNAEFLMQNMEKYPMCVSLWSKQKIFSIIGSTIVPWDPKFITFLKLVMNCEEPPPVEVRDSYNIFEEDTAKIIATIAMKVTLRYLTDRVTSTFRSLSEDPKVKKFLYTGMNSKVTSFICNMKTKDEIFDENCNKIKNSFTKDQPVHPQPIKYADYTNAPSANILTLKTLECCLRNDDKPPDSKYKTPETCPDIDYISEYVQKLIISCNDAMRMMTPRPTIRPRVRATDIDRLCYCRETSWPSSRLADRFRQEVQGPPCPLCTNKGRQGSPQPNVFELANVRGPCGSTECKVAREVREFIATQVNEDNEVFHLKNLIGPCGSRSCTIAGRIGDFIQHRGPFEHDRHTKEGMSTQCDCHKILQDSLKITSCTELCSKDCENADSSDSSEVCGGPGCPYDNNSPKVYQVYYFTVEYGKTLTESRASSSAKSSSSVKSSPSTKSSHSPKSSPKCSRESSKVSDESEESDNNTGTKYCAPDCPTVKDNTLPCSKSLCFPGTEESKPAMEHHSDKCISPECPRQTSPEDSHVEIPFSAIRNPCCVKDCKLERDVKEFIVQGLGTSSAKKSDTEDPCYCDCSCDFKFSSARTTYCAVCGGYECLGDDVRALPEYRRPHPCPVYHKLYNRKYIKTKSPWPEENEGPSPPADAQSTKSKASVSKSAGKGALSTKRTVVNTDVAAKDKKKKSQPTKEKTAQNKKISKFTANTARTTSAEQNINRHVECHTTIIPVPKNMGWNWKADDIPGVKFHPDWKPGCAHKRLVNRYRHIREPLESILAKKRLKALLLANKKKKTALRPTVLISKKDGEYNVQMQVFKKYSKERLLYQFPFDDTKPPLEYTIGKTEEEKAKIKKQRERRERRKNRRKSKLIQSAFRDKCQEICVKAYKEAIGVLPMPNANFPDCPCGEVQPVNPYSPPADSCSCSESDTISSSDTDGDEWTVEFYAPAARWDPQAKYVPRYAESSTQYTYLDYKVKVLDKNGNQVPRFFKGPDGAEVCSDLGGFWDPEHTHWLEINKDGIIGVDNRWIPFNFIGPDGLPYSGDDDTYVDSKGQTYKIGVDGYIINGKWAWYKKPLVSKSRSATTATTAQTKKIPEKKAKQTAATKDGKVSPQAVTMATSNSIHAGAKVHKGRPIPIVSPPDRGPLKVISLPPGVRAKPHRCQLYRAKVNRGENLQEDWNIMSPSSKYTDMRKLSKYNEIMHDLNMCDEFVEFKTPNTVNRACMTTAVGEPLVKQDSIFESNLRAARAQMVAHRRLRPIDSMKIYGINSLRAQQSSSASGSASYGKS